MKTFAFNQIIEELRKEFESNASVLAMLVTGSVAREEAKEGDDVDILIVTDGEKNSREYRKGESLVEIGTVIFPESLEKIERNPMQVYMYLDAKAIFDKGNYLEKLQKKSQEVLDNYQPTEKDGKEIQKWLSSVVDKVTVARKNREELKVGFHISNVLWKTVEGLYLINNMPVPASTSALRRVTSLKVLPNNFETLWEKALVGDLEERTDATLELMKFVLSKLDAH